MDNKLNILRPFFCGINSANNFFLGLRQIEKKLCRNRVNEYNLDDHLGVPGVTNYLPARVSILQTQVYSSNAHLSSSERDRDVSARSSELKVSTSARIVKS